MTRTKKVFLMISGLENAKFVRYGVMHKNNFINSLKVLNKFLQLKTNPNIFFAGQITGVEGYVESCVSGLITAINIANYINDQEMAIPSSNSVSCALLNYINKASITNFQPMKANWGIVEEINFIKPNRKVTKQEIKKLKNEKFSELAINSIKEFIKNI